MNFVLHLENDVLEIKGATKIVSSSHTQAVVETEQECVVITGSEIEVKGLDLEKTEALMSGKFVNIKFADSKGKKQPLLKRIFK